MIARLAQDAKDSLGGETPPDQETILTRPFAIVSRRVPEADRPRATRVVELVSSVERGESRRANRRRDAARTQLPLDRVPADTTASSRDGVLGEPRIGEQSPAFEIVERWRYIRDAEPAGC